MKAIIVDQKQNLSWEEIDRPVPAPNEILIKVRCAGVNRADLMQRRGLYMPPPNTSSILGLECSGTVELVGKKCRRFKEGDRVCALLSGGGYGEYVVVDETSALPVPEGFSLEQAAGIPEVFGTAWLNLFHEARLIEGETVLIHAGASGVGTAAIQLCRLFGCECFVTVGAESKLKRCRDLGASGGAVRTRKDLWSSIKAFSEPKGFDVILDPVGGSYFLSNFSVLAIDGRLVIIGLMGGSKTELNLAEMLTKRIRIIGSTLRSRPLFEKAELMKTLEDRIWPKFESGEISPVIEKIFPIQEAEEAHRFMASNETIGKLLLIAET
ncbi:MAG: NAD(P)H-quinone oxidoreductase [Gammaproteobacteria bacterium]|nr:NAD(P)H-quinone oxidoreductase [Gammaproteobacteria bacterium]